MVQSLHAFPIVRRSQMPPDRLRDSILGERCLYKPAYAVHALTASGVIPAALATYELTQVDCDPRIVFGYLLLTTLIDAIDGPLARKFSVKRNAKSIDGRVIDDILDYLTFAFIPLMMIWRMEWLPSGFGFTVVYSMMASLLGFAHHQAKNETDGVFRGFPSYWNLYAIYAGVIAVQLNPWWTAITMWTLTALTIAPVWVLYPNLAPRRLKRPLFAGGLLWILCLIVILSWDYPNTALWFVVATLAYPVFYVLASIKHLQTLR